MGTYIEMILPYSQCSCCMDLTGPQGPCKYSTRVVMPSVTASSSLLSLRFMGSKIGRVLVLSLLWVALPCPLSPRSTGLWQEKSPTCHLVENGDQCAIVLLVCPQVQAEDGGAVDEPLQGPVGVMMVLLKGNVMVPLLPAKE